MTFRPPRSLPLLFVVLAAAAAPAAATRITGRLLDANGAVSPATKLTLRSAADRVVANTDARGRFDLDVPPGTYVALTGEADVAASEQVVVTASAADVVLNIPPVLAGDITVHATHIAVDPDSIPGSVDIIDRDTLQSSRVFDFGEALRKVAGVNVRDEEGFGLRPNIGIRGLNPTRSTKVLLLEDGIPVTYAPYGDNSSYYHPPVERFDSIEVLKGSGQVAYGPATVGGVINYITPAPPTTPTTTLSLAAGNRDYLNAHLGYGATVGRTGVLFNLMRKQGDGARENIHSSLNDMNAKVVFDLTERQKLTMRANYYSEDSQVTYSGLRQAEYDADPRQNPFRNDDFEGDRWGASATHALRLSESAMLTTSLYGMSFDRFWWRQSSNSSQRPNDAADVNCGGMANLNTTCGNEGRLRKYWNAGIEPRLQIDHRLFGLRNHADFGVRAHFENQDRIQKNGDTPNARDGRIVESNVRKNHAFSAFAQNRFAFGNWSVTPGVRVEQIEYERINRLANSGTGVSGDTSLTQVVPGLGAAYHLGETTVFAGVHRGFAPPRTEDVINNNTGGVVELDPELSWNSELGVRSTITPGLHVDATIFRMAYENQIVPASVAGGTGATLTNGGATLHEGAELSARVDSSPLFGTTHNASLRVAYTFLPESKYTGVRTSSVAGNSAVSISGNRLPYSPEHTLNVGVGYLFPTGLEGLVEAVHVSQQFGDDLNTIAPSADGQRGLIPSYTTYNATLNFEVRPLRSIFFVTVKNLFDDTYIVDRTRGIAPGSPRLVQAGFSFRM